VRIRIRLDGGFANPELLAFLDAEADVEYVVAMASNAVLNRKAEEAMQVARVLAGLTDRTEHVYSEARYAAGSWQQERRVILKAEVVRAEDKAPKDNPRFVITNMKQSPQWLYEEVYCRRAIRRELHRGWKFCLFTGHRDSARRRTADSECDLHSDRHDGLHNRNRDCKADGESGHARDHVADTGGNYLWNGAQRESAKRDFFGRRNFQLFAGCRNGAR
jgi:hypothetical protein